MAGELSVDGGAAAPAQPAAGLRFQSGDIVVAAPPGETPIGRIDSVLAARGGARLVIAVAYFVGRYVAIGEAEVAGTSVDTSTSLRIHTLRLDAAAVRRLPAYRRVLGRLMPDPSLAVPSSYPGDVAAQSALDQALSDDPLMADAAVQARVRYGVAVLTGWVRSVGAKVAADRLARTAPGIWDSRNRLQSDEELTALARRQVVAAPDLARAVQRITVDLGRVSVEVDPASGVDPDATARRLALDGARDMAVVPAAPRTDWNEREGGAK